MAKTVAVTDQVHAYMMAKGVREAPALARCRAETAKLGRAAIMQIAPEQGAFMGLLARAAGVKRYLEVGSFTGYSMLSVMLALPDDARATACDLSADYLKIAQGHWQAAGIGARIESRVGPAVDTLNALVEDGRADTYDFAFIDADKGNYSAYYEAALTLLRPGGILALDNVLWSGAVADPSAHDADTLAIRAVNDRVAADARVDVSMLPVADGLTLCLKR